MKALQVDGGGEFIPAKLRSFCKKQNIVIKYTAPYIYKENELAKQGWRIIVMIKNLMLIDSVLLNDF